MSGRARLTQDKALIDKFWTPLAGAWFEKGKDDPDVALLEVKIDMGEHWKADSNKAFQLFQMAKASLTGGTPEVGENEKFG